MKSNTSLKVREPVIIDSFDSLNKLAHGIRTFRLLPGSKRFVLELGELSSEDNKNATKLLNSYYNDCGCSSGSHIMGLTVIITTSLYFITGGRFSSIGIRQILWLAGLTFLGAIAGKIAGLLRARIRLLNLVKTINVRLQNPQII